MIYSVYGLSLLPAWLCAPALLFTAAAAMSHSTEPRKASHHESHKALTVTRGGRMPIELSAICKMQALDCVPDSYEIVTPPTEGALFNRTGKTVFNYQHAGTSDQPDAFQFTARGPDGSLLGPVDVIIKVLHNDARLAVLFPQPGQVIEAGDLVVRYQFSGRDVDHLHVTLGDSAHVSLYEPAGSHTFAQLAPGAYVLDAALVASDHGRIAGTRVQIAFTVSAQGE